MSDEFRPEVLINPSVQSPSHQTISQILSAKQFADLYEIVLDEGLTYFPRINAEGDVELFLVFESIEEFSSSTHGEVYVEFRTYQDKLLAVIWTLDNPLDPLGFPVPFRIQERNDRYMALRLMHQPQTWIHYLALDQKQIIHIFSEAISLPDTEKKRMEECIHALYVGKSGSITNGAYQENGDSEILEYETESISAHQLPEETLVQTGDRYVFDYQQMTRAHGADNAQVVLMEAVHQALLMIRRHFKSEVRETDFTVWVAEQGHLLSMFITPGMEGLFVDKSAEEDENPISKTLSNIPQLIEQTEGTPLALGAYPIMRYEQGKWMHLELDESFQSAMQLLFAKQYPTESNPYNV